jgi:hypothetical protein
LVIKARREVVVPRFASHAYSRIGLTQDGIRKAFLFNSRRAYKRLEVLLQMVFICMFHFKSFETLTPSSLACVTFDC